MAKIKVIDKVMKIYNLKLNKLYEVIRKDYIEDDMYYIVKNEEGELTAVHELLAIEQN